MIKVQYPPQQQGKIQFSTFVSRCVDIFHRFGKQSKWVNMIKS